MGHVGESYAKSYSHTTGQVGVADSEYIEFKSKQGAIVVRAKVMESISPGKEFIPMHFAVNELMQEKLDP